MKFQIKTCVLQIKYELTAGPIVTAKHKLICNIPESFFHAAYHHLLVQM